MQKQYLNIKVLNIRKEDSENHEKRLGGKIEAICEKLGTECGLFVNTHPANVGVTKEGRIVLFDVVRINADKMQKAISSMPNNLRKKQIQSVFDELKKHEFDGWIEISQLAHYGQYILNISKSNPKR